MSSFEKLELYNYVSKPVLGFFAMYLYNVFIEGRQYSDNLCLYDGWIMAGSVLIAKLTKDIIVQLANIDNKFIQSKLIEPIVNAFVYHYGYNNIIRGKFSSRINPRSATWNYLLAGVGNIIISYAENPLVGMIGGIKNY